MADAYAVFSHRGQSSEVGEVYTRPSAPDLAQGEIESLMAPKLKEMQKT
jgi:hypothetical protein